jgi:hypothetical protein
MFSYSRLCIINQKIQAELKAQIHETTVNANRHHPESIEIIAALL